MRCLYQTFRVDDPLQTVDLPALCDVHSLGFTTINYQQILLLKVFFKRQNIELCCCFDKTLVSVVKDLCDSFKISSER